MEVGVRTRSRAALAKAVQSSSAAKRRKVREFAKLTETSSLVELGGSRTVAAAERSAGDRENPTLNFDREAQASCCSSYYGSSEIADDNHNRERDGQKRTEENLQQEEEEEEEEVFVDLKDDESNEVETSSSSSSCRERREMTPSSKLREESDGVESTSKPTVVNPGRRSSSSSISPPLKMPSKSELEEFFAAAEKDIQKRFADKYNFDVVKDTPVEGRYEWVRIKP